MCLDMCLNDASLSYQYLGDSIAENYEKYKYIASLENTLKTKEEHIKTKDEHIADLENTLKTKEEKIERLNNSLINSTSSGRTAQFSFHQGSQFVCGPQRPQVIARTIPPLIVPKAFPPSVPKAFQHRSSRSAPYQQVEHYS